MKSAFLSLGILLSAGLARASTVCNVAVADAGKQSVLLETIQNVRWSTDERREWNTFDLSETRKSRFTLETVMVNPDSGIETITVEGAKAGDCNSDFLFRDEASGQSTFAGVKTACTLGSKLSVTIRCYF